MAGLYDFDPDAQVIDDVALGWDDPDFPSSSGPTIWSAAADLTGAGSMSAAAIRTTFVSAAMTGAGSLSVTFAGLFNAAAALVGSGTLSATAVRAVSATVALTGVGTLSASATSSTPPALRAIYFTSLDDFAANTGGEDVEVSDERSFMAEHRGMGTANLIQQLDDPVQPAAGGVIAWDLYGVRAFASLCKRRSSKTVGAVEADQQTTWQMPGHLDITRKGPIQPPGGVGRFPVAGTIAFNYTHFDYDDSAWDPANVLYSFAALVAAWAFISGATIVPGAGFSGDSASMIGPTSATTTDAPEGDWYFRGTVTVPAAGPYTIYLTSDDYATLYLDGISILTNGGFTQSTSQVFALSAGTHVFAGTVHQYGPNPFFPALNPTYVGVAGFPGGGIFEGDTPTFTSDSSWKVLDYPADIPGMTVTNVMRLVHESFAGRAWADAITDDFDDTTDTAGNTLATLNNITATVGRDTWADLIQKLQQYAADIRMDPNGLTLQVYEFGYLNQPSGVEYEIGRNVLELTHDQEDVVADALLVRSDALGWSTVGTGDTQTFIELGSEVAATEIGSIGGELIGDYGDVRTQITVTTDPDPAASPGEIPWVNTDYVPGCIASAPDIDLSPTDEIVLALGCAVTGRGDFEALSVQVILKDRIQDIQDRFVQEVKQ